MRVRSYVGMACIAAMMAAAPAAASATGTRSYTGGRFQLDIAAGGGGFLASFDKGGEGILVLEPDELLACKSFPDTACGQQLIIADSSNFTNGSDDFDIIGFGYDPGNCCQFVYFYFPDRSFASGGWYQSLSLGPFATLQITAVPEPDNWALLIAGFGLTGAILRRRRPATA